jgi:hypothetical protein
LRGHQCALVDVGKAGDAVERRLHDGVGQIQISLVELRLQPHHLALRPAKLGLGHVEGGLRDGLAVDQLLLPVAFDPRQALGGAGGDQPALDLRDGRAVLGVLDAEQDVPRLHRTALDEGAAFDEAGDARLDRHLLRGDGAAGQDGDLADLRHRGGCGDHRRQRHLLLGKARMGAGEQHDRDSGGSSRPCQ